jgi:hypothetical protein
VLRLLVALVVLAAALANIWLVRGARGIEHFYELTGGLDYVGPQARFLFYYRAVFAGVAFAIPFAVVGLCFRRRQKEAMVGLAMLFILAGAEFALTAHLVMTAIEPHTMGLRSRIGRAADGAR